jgi:hypothetical protein
MRAWAWIAFGVAAGAAVAFFINRRA